MSKKMTTKERILESACALFAEKGFQGTTTQDICAAAEANIAAVNYHFGGKENLYREVWAVLFERDEIENGMQSFENAVEAEEVLKTFIHRRIKASLDKSGGGWRPRIVHNEMSSPSPLHEEIIEQYMKPRRKRFHDLLRCIVGEGMDEEVLHLAGFFIHSPMIHLTEIHSRVHRGKKKCKHPGFNAEMLADVLTTFALAGLRDLVEKAKSKESEK